VTQSVKNLLNFTVSLSLGLGILYAVYYQQQADYEAGCDMATHPYQCSFLRQMWADFLATDWRYFGLASFIAVLSNAFRALRWDLMLKPLGHRIDFINGLSAVNIGYFTNLAFSRVGEVIRAGVATRYEDIPMDKAFGTIVVERIVDVIIFAIVAVLALLFGYDKIINYLLTKGDFSALSNLKWVIPFFLIMLLSFYFFWKNLEKIKESRLGSKVVKFVNNMVEGVVSIGKMEQKWLFIFYSIGVWACYFAMTWLIFKAYAPTQSLSPVVVLVVLLFGSLGMFIPSPGGMGSFQFLVSEALIIYGVKPMEAFTYANLQFFTLNVAVVVIFGLISYLILPLYNGSKSTIKI
jgi:glycosyltransferase 2 family protein